MKRTIISIALAAATIAVLGGAMRLMAQPQSAVPSGKRVALDHPAAEKTPKKPKPIGEPRS